MNAPTPSLSVLALLFAGCVSPTVVVVDQKTALEQQAAGDYPPLENELEQAGLAPSPEPFTRDELAAGRAQSGSGVLGELGELYARAETDADVIDRLLLQRCIGEAESGLLVPRPSECVGATDATELARVIGRENLHRRQLWELLARDGAASVERVRVLWRAQHLEQVQCGGLVESAGSWGPKPC
jgi:hypothetical protein